MKFTSTLIAFSLLLLLSPDFSIAQDCNNTFNTANITHPAIKTGGSNEKNALKKWKEYMEDSNGVAAEGFFCNDCPDNEPCTMVIDLDSCELKGRKIGGRWHVGGANGPGNPYKVGWKCEYCDATTVISVDIDGGDITPVVVGDGTGPGGVVLGGGRLADPDLESTVFPNPTRNQLNVRLKVCGTEEELSVRIVDLSGRLVIEEKLPEIEGSYYTYQTSMADEPAGHYQFILFSNGTPISTKAFQVQ